MITRPVYSSDETSGDGANGASLNGPITLVCACSDTYSMPLAVTLRSAMSNMSGDQPVELIILDGGIREPNKRRLRRTVECRPRVRVSFLAPPAQSLQGLPTTDKYPLAVYFRLLLPDLLPASIQRVLYIDGDLVVEGDLARLWQKDMNGWHALAVQDICHRYIKKTNHLSRPEFKVDEHQKYFNSGVMLIDLEKWRRDRVAAHAMEYLRKYPECMLFADQDGLNLALAGKWGELDPCWNQIHEIHEYKSWKDSPYDEQTFLQVLNHPHIIHFTTPPKPWMTGCVHPYRDRFFKYLDQTDWAGWRNTLMRRALRRVGSGFTSVLESLRPQGQQG